MRNRIEETLKQEASLPEAASGLLKAIAPLDLGPRTRQILCSLLKWAPKEGSDYLWVGFNVEERNALCELLDSWEATSPFQKFVIHLALQHFLIARLWGEIARSSGGPFVLTGE